MSGADAVVDRFRAEIIRAASVLDELESASQAEAWSSGALADWWDLGAPGSLAELLAGAEPLAAALVAYLEGAGADVVGVSWGSDVGRHEIVAAHELRASSDSSGSAEEIAIVLEYEAPGGDRHDVSVTIRDGQLVDAALGPAGLLDSAGDGAFPLEHEPLTPADATRRVADALAMVSVGVMSEVSESGRANLPILLRRFRLAPEVISEVSDGRASVELPVRDPEDDQYAASLIVSVLRVDRGAEPPASVVAAFDGFHDTVEPHDLDVLAEVAGVDTAEELSFATYLRLVGAYLAPVSLSAHGVDAQRELSCLEWADWLGAILGATRAGAGVEIDGDVLVSFINRCPEITTSIPKSDAVRVAWAFEQALFSWEVTGVIDGDARLTEAGVWLLPRAALAAWEQS
ncbi:MAG: hypothetical protein HKN94_04950 [Acidimicrobiales bacterium]|nr:hypothetical protein [Acidimicrobiales bacterium]